MGCRTTLNLKTLRPDFLNDEFVQLRHLKARLFIK
jgi:hypothetical protein